MKMVLKSTRSSRTHEKSAIIRDLILVFLVILLASWLLVSCSKEDTTPTHYLRFTSEITTHGSVNTRTYETLDGIQYNKQLIRFFYPQQTFEVTDWQSVDLTDREAIGDMILWGGEYSVIDDDNGFITISKVTSLGKQTAIYGN